MRKLHRVYDINENVVPLNQNILYFFVVNSSLKNQIVLFELI